MGQRTESKHSSSTVHMFNKRTFYLNANLRLAKQHSSRAIPFWQLMQGCPLVAWTLQSLRTHSRAPQGSISSTFLLK